MGCGRLRGAVAGAAVLLALAAMAAPVGAVQEEQVAERIFLVRDAPGSQTQFQMIVQAGCNDEPDGQCRGLAHYLEHLVLTGRNREHTDIAVRLFPDVYSNGWTSARATAYVHSVPARNGGPKADLEKLFAFYAARLQRLRHRRRGGSPRAQRRAAGARLARHQQPVPPLRPQARPRAAARPSGRPVDHRHQGKHPEPRRGRGTGVPPQLVCRQQRPLRGAGRHLRRRPQGDRR